MNSKRGPKPHQDRPTTIKLRLPSSLLDRLRRWAQTHGTTISDILRNGAEERIKGDSMAQTNDIFPLPPWAVGRSDGTYMQIGANLPTRDGRRCGNGYVDSIEGSYAVVVTDMGSVFRMTLGELREMFYPPEYIMGVSEARSRRGVSL